MKVCTQCGSTNLDQANFCRACGKPLNAVPTDGSVTGDTPTQPAAPTSQTAPQTPAPQSNAQQPAFTPQPTGTQAPATQPAVPQPAPNQAAPTQPVSTQPFAYQGPTMQPAGVQTPTPAGPTAGAIPTQPNQFQLMLNWMWTSFKRPSQQSNAASWWPVATIALNALFVAIAVFSFESRAYNGTIGRASGLANSFLNALGSSASVSETLPITEFFKALFTFFAMFYVIIGLTFAGIAMLGDKQRPFRVFHIEIAQKLMPLMAVNILIAVSGLLGSMMLSTFLILIEFCYLLIIPPTLIGEARNTRHLDKTWMWIFATFLVGLALIIIVALLTAIGLDSVFSSLASSF